jgi:hypothetical protein
VNERMSLKECSMIQTLGRTEGTERIAAEILSDTQTKKKVLLKKKEMHKSILKKIILFLCRIT